MDAITQEIKVVRNRVLNSALVVISIFGVISHSTALLRAIMHEFNATFYIQTFVLVLLVLTTVYRKKLSLGVKTFVFSSIIIIAIIAGMVAYGILASSTIFIVALPVFASFMIPLKRAVILLISLIGVYVLFGVLFSVGILEYAIEINTYLTDSSIWIIGSSIDTIIAASGILFVGHYFTKALIKNSSKIEEQKNELQKHKEILELIVQERTSDLENANKKLKNANEKVRDKNTKLKSTLKNLKKAQIQLVHSEKMASLGVLTAGVAHEINNPLNYILGGYTGLKHFLERNNSLNEEAEFLLNSIKTGIDKSAAIVSGLNEFSRDVEDFNEQCDIHMILDNCLLMLNNQIKNRITVTKGYTKDSSILEGNVGKLHQVFINLLTNACQAIGDKGEINITTIKEDNKFVTEISDSGAGISKENLSKIADPFFTTKEPGVGTGLGLSICFTIIKSHNGEIDIQSKPKQGTTVKVILPLKYVMNG